jgi:hypothetical protein
MVDQKIFDDKVARFKEVRSMWGYARQDIENYLEYDAGYDIIREYYRGWSKDDLKNLIIAVDGQYSP